MRNREEVVQMILEWGRDGKEIDITELAKIEGIVDKTSITDRLISNSVKQRLRVLIQRVFANEGMKVRSVRKNVYKVVDESSSKDCHQELLRLTRMLHKAQKKVDDYKYFMIKKGHPVQIEMIASLAMEGGEANVQDEKSSSVRPTVRTSAKSKKVVNG